MGFRVVCISRATAAGGENIGQALAQQLGFRYVDEQIIERAAEQAQVNPALVAKVEQRQPLLQRLLERIPPGAEFDGEFASLTGDVPNLFTFAGKRLPRHVRRRAGTSTRFATSVPRGRPSRSRSRQPPATCMSRSTALPGWTPAFAGMTMGAGVTKRG